MPGTPGHLPRGPARTLKALGWSLQGLRAAWLHESSFRLEVVMAAAMLPAALYLGDSGLQRAVLMLPVLMVLSLELLNSAIEAVIERYGAEHHELAGRAKDMGSAAVFVALFATAATWLLILAS
ncbi:diacylglycerol kinase [Stenotrophomonas tumulicola]|uniref:Diacylglycerol kinase n=1 Tax=Stenotrophomonas tumulicola TaxID=1685415 RepID=A0A7W3FK13_9GAMM|nr:diacylglycerol kinase [Stenotrophomonas tumulicola]MBA8680920.1 diacylglycerol kinase [Stenotrophomonas tumulicola]